MRLKWILLALSLSACAAPVLPLSEQTGQQRAPGSLMQTAPPSTRLQGRVVFPGGYRLAADAESVRARATISLLYPPDHGSRPHQSAAAGSTDADGRFSLSPGSEFSPQQGEWYILEASRRIPGKARQSLRTWIRRNNGSWQSFTTPDLVLDAGTTGLSALLEWQSLDSASLLGSRAGTVYTPPLTGPSQSDYDQALALSEYLLAQGQDPVATLALSAEELLPRRLTNPQREILLATRHCPSCELEGSDFGGEDLSLTQLERSNLRRADLRGANLTAARLAGANLAGAQLAGATWVNGLSCEAGSVGACRFEQRINEETVSFQERPQIAIDSAGNFVVTWASLNQDGNDYGIYARRYDAQGLARGPEFAVNTYTSGRQQLPDVAMAADGSFVIAWQSVSDDPNAEGVDIYARRYDASGLPQGQIQRVNAHVFGSQNRPRLGVDAQGRYVVVWYCFNRQGVFARRLGSDGTPVGNEIGVNMISRGQPQWPEIAVGPGGSFAVAWEDFDSDNLGVFARVFDAEGAALSNDLAVNQHQADLQDFPSLGMDQNGDFVVTWQSRYQDEAGLDSVSGGVGTGIYARRFGADGTALSDEQLVNTTIYSQQDYPQLAMSPGGDYAIIWESWWQDSPDSPGVFLQRFDASGRHRGPETRVNSTVAQSQQRPCLALSPEGQMVAAWESFNQDGSLSGIYAKQLGDPQ